MFFVIVLSVLNFIVLINCESYVAKEYQISVDSLGKTYTLFSQYYVLDICADQTEKSTRINGDDKNHVKITIQDGNVTFCRYNDTICDPNQLLYCDLNIKLGEKLPNEYFESEPGKYESFSVYSLQNSYPEPVNEEGNYVRLNLFPTNMCEGDPKESVFIRSGKCVPNWSIFGNINRISDQGHLTCDENTMVWKIFEQLECQKLLFVNYFNMAIITLIELFVPGFTLCFNFGLIENYYLGIQCANNPEEFNEFKSEANYMTNSLYYRNNANNKCIGSPTLKFTFKLDECTGGEIINANKEIYTHKNYGVNDQNCEEYPDSMIYIKTGELLADPNAEEEEIDDTCFDYWLYKMHAYYFKPTFYNTYNLNDFDGYMALIPGVDCNDPNDEIITRFKNEPVGTFYYVQSDFCFSTKTIFAFDITLISYKGFCDNGELKLKEYGSNSYCENTFNMIESTDHFCTNSFYFTCLTYICYDYEAGDPNVCNGRGECINFNQCNCISGFSGNNCSEIVVDNTYLLFVLPSITFLLILIIIILVVSFLIIIYIFFRIKKQKKTLNEFLDIDDIDILLKESKIEKEEQNMIEGQVSFTKIKFNTKSFEANMNDIQLIKEIGSGGSGSKIFIAEWNGRKIAYKLFKTNFFGNQSNYEEFEKEVQFAINLRHPHILDFYAASIQEPRIGILMELCENGSLKSYIEKQSYKKKKILFTTKIRWLSEIASALKYLHSIDVIHRDMKSDNVLLTKDLKIKVMDFGLSKKVIKSEEDALTMKVGTSFYMAPEVLHSTQYTNKVDTFSFAIMMWELYYQNFNIYGDDSYSIRGLEYKVANDPRFRPIINPEDEKRYPDYFNLMRKGWSGKAEERPDWNTFEQTFEDLMELLNLAKDFAAPKRKINMFSVLQQSDKKIAKLKSILKRTENLFSKKKKQYEKEIEEIENLINKKGKKRK